jgi:hypothetical protein
MKRRSIKKQAVVAATMLRMMRNQYEALRPDHRRPALDIRTDATLTQQEFRADQRIRAYELGNLAYENDPVGAIVDTCVYDAPLRPTPRYAKYSIEMSESM